MQSNLVANSSWQSVLESPPSASHILQIYESDAFLSSAVAHFAAAGLKAGEAVLLTGTQAHLAGIERELRAIGVDVAAAARDAQLMLSDVHESIVQVVPDGRLEPSRFDAVACGALDEALADRRFSGVRWWGEISHLMLQRGDAQGALAAEDRGDALARKHGIMLLCSYFCDRFDPQSYDGTLKDICCKHTHVIPAEDYVRHRLAVNKAIEEVIGEIRGTMLQSLLSWKGLPCELPSSQALLFWVREALPERFAEVLARAKAHQRPRSSMEAA